MTTKKYKHSYPLWVAVEGCDGSGKSTAVKLLTEYLSKIGPVSDTKAVGANGPGIGLRTMYVDDKLTEPMKPIASVLMHLEHYTCVMDYLGKDNHVVSDRHIGSFYALNKHLLKQDNANSIFIGILNNPEVFPRRPDLTIYLDSSNENITTRTKNRPNNNILDSKFSIVIDTVKEGFAEFFNIYDGKSVSIINDGSIYELELQIKLILSALFSEKQTT